MKFKMVADDDIPAVFSFRCERGIQLPELSLPTSDLCNDLDFTPADDAIVICSYPASGAEIINKIVTFLKNKESRTQNESPDLRRKSSLDDSGENDDSRSNYMSCISENSIEDDMEKAFDEDLEDVMSSLEKSLEKSKDNKLIRGTSKTPSEESPGDPKMERRNSDKNGSIKSDVSSTKSVIQAYVPTASPDGLESLRLYRIGSPIKDLVDSSSRTRSPLYCCKPPPLSGIIYTHLPFCLTRFNPNCKYIFVVRNPKQVCVSYYYYYKEICKKIFGKLGRENCSFNTFYKLFIRGRVAFGDYFVHTKSWMERTCIPGCHCLPQIEDPAKNRLLTVRFEDIEEDARGVVTKLMDFLEVRDCDIEEVICKLEEECGEKGCLEESIYMSCGEDMTDDCVGEGKKMGVSGGWESHSGKDHRSIFEDWVKWNGNAGIYNKFWYEKDQEVLSKE